MKDKFDIFVEVLKLESETNHYGIYIPIGQMTELMVVVQYIYSNWDDTKTLQENVKNKWQRVITPMGDGGKNRL